jgi:hypothetical protein
MAEPCCVVCGKTYGVVAGFVGGESEFSLVWPGGLGDDMT